MLKYTKSRGTRLARFAAAKVRKKLETQRGESLILGFLTSREGIKDGFS